MILKEKERAALEDLQTQEKAVWRSMKSMQIRRRIRS